MAETVDELTVEWRDDSGELITRQLDKEVLTKGTWATLIFLYQDVDRATGGWGKPKMRIQRYQKRNGQYRAHSKFNISSIDQALQIAEILQRWAKEQGG
jgi:hypothetical protein